MKPLLRRLTVVLLPLALSVPVAVSTPEVAHGADARAHPQCRRTLGSYPVLHAGDRRPAVRTLQCALNDLGLGPVVVDGYYGPQTKRVVLGIVSQFEGDLPKHPYRINNGMWTLLHGRQLPDRQLARGAKGHAVRVLQRALRAAGGDLVVDGWFGPQTERVVRQYQRAQGNRPTGRVELSTRFLLAMGGVIGGLS